jgi:hypothetical protein
MCFRHSRWFQKIEQGVGVVLDLGGECLTKGKLKVERGGDWDLSRYVIGLACRILIWRCLRGAIWASDVLVYL